MLKPAEVLTGPQHTTKTVEVCLVGFFCNALITTDYFDSEPLRAEPNGFLVHLLSHSDTVSYCVGECGHDMLLDLGGHVAAPRYFLQAESEHDSYT